MYRRNQKRRHIVSTNIAACFTNLNNEQQTNLVKQHFQAYTCALLDYSILFFRSRQWLLKRIDIDGLDKLDKVIKKENNVLLLLGHSVWLEFAPVAIGHHYTSYGSYKPFNNPVFDYLIARSRLKDVAFIIAREEGMIKLVRSLKPGRLLFFLADQDHGEKHSVFAPFFATNKATLTSPARIAKLGKATTFPVMAFFDKSTGKYLVKIGNALDKFGQHTPEQDTKLMNIGFEQLIQDAPEQYLWMLKLLRTRPMGEKPLY